MTDLARRAVACRHFRWLPGMLTTGRIRITCVEDDGAYILGIPAGWHQQVLVEHGDRCPDLTDPATLGCLLYLVREAWGDEGITTQDLDGYDAYGWVCVVDTARLSPGKEYPHTKHGVTWFDGVTEAEALVVALETAP